MPLAFDSISHGRIAFGFFNIDSDMLLLEHYFFFADEFCGKVSEIARSDAGERFEAAWEVYHIAKREDIGDLMGAIGGTRFTGFIGETYRRYPFPQREEDFKQKPQGFETQAVFRDMIRKYASQVEIQLVAAPRELEVSIGEYRFSRDWFCELIKYVWAGGFPRWKGEERPGYVLKMKDEIERSEHWLFVGFRLQGWAKRN